jgi:2-dehydro-3-deoxy-D-gluconate 5-dehydrogenase
MTTTWGPFSVEGQAVIITGGAMGIGLGIAKRFVEGGANVVLADLDEAALQRSSKALSSVGPGKVTTLQVDVGRDEAGVMCVKRCLESFGRLDVLVNDAGIFPQVPALKMSTELFDKVQRVNVRGLVFISQAVGRHFAETKQGGRIINIGSVDSLHPSMVGLAAYDTSKGGVLMFTKSFALEMAPYGVTVNAILPGGVATEGTSKPLEGSGMSKEQMEAMMSGFINTKIPMKRMGQPDDMAGAAIFFASKAASYVTGAALVIDGGMLLT